MSRMLCLLSLMIAANSTSAAEVDSLRLPLSADGIQKYLSDHPTTNVESFLGALPRSLKENFVLMHTSRSLHHATPTAPRQIMFGSDARFLLAAGGVPEDPRYNELEFAEFAPTTGTYHFGVISFSENKPATVTKDVAFCQNCHGAKPHPIWGAYPDWSGAYGDDEGKIEPKLQQSFAEFRSTANSSSRYKHLAFKSTPDRFLLPTRFYPYPNTDFNHELGNTMAIGVLERLKHHPDYLKWAGAALATSSDLQCIKNKSWPSLTKRINAAYKPLETKYQATSKADIKVLRLLGVDPVVELSLEKLGDAAGGGGNWQTGAYRLEEAITFQLLVDLMGRDQKLANLFATEKKAITSIRNYALLVGEPRANALRTSSSWFLFFDVFDPITKTPSRRTTVCDYLIGETDNLESDL